MRIPVSLATFTALVLVGAGCAATPVPSDANQPASVPTAPVAVIHQPIAPDPYEGWGTIEPGGVVSLRIPPGCQGDPGAGNIYVTCGKDQGDATKTVLHTSSDGTQVNVRHGAIADWDQWDKVIASLKVKPGLGRDVQINVEK